MTCHSDSQLAKQLSITVSIPKLSENGQMQEKYSLNGHPQGREESSYTDQDPQIRNNQIKSKLYIVGSQAKNKKMTFKDKSNQFKNDSQNIKCSKTLGQVSTFNEKTSSPFWTQHCKAWSKKLWSPAKIDYVVSPLNSMNGCLRAKEQGLSSWNKTICHPNVSSQMMSFPSYKFSAVGEMAQDVIIPKVHKVKLNPTKKQKKQLRNWEAAYRFTYNKALDMKRDNRKLSKFDLRTMVVTDKQNLKTIEKGKGMFGKQEHNPFIQDNPWLKKVPKDIRQQAAFEAYKNFKQFNGNVGYKEKGKSGWTIGIENNVIRMLVNNKIRLYSNKMKVVLRTFGKLPNWLQPSVFENEIMPPCQVLLQKYGISYYMIFPHKEKIFESQKTFDGHMVGLDPGIRKFQTCFGTDGQISFIGSRNPMRKFLRINWYLDYLKSTISSPKSSPIRVTGSQRNKTKKKIRKTQERLENIRKDFHHKSAKWLTDRYKCIVIGKLPKNIISRDRTLPKSVKRSFNSLAHFKFRCCLKDKCQRKGVIYQEINEAYTSKTCTMCGKLNNVGSSETYKCDCQTESWDRDANGARNILLKGISESFLRIVLKKDETLSLKSPCWCNHPQGHSLGLEILQES